MQRPDATTSTTLFVFILQFFFLNLFLRNKRRGFSLIIYILLIQIIAIVRRIFFGGGSFEAHAIFSFFIKVGKDCTVMIAKKILSFNTSGNIPGHEGLDNAVTEAFLLANAHEDSLIEDEEAFKEVHSCLVGLANHIAPFRSVVGIVENDDPLGLTFERIRNVCVRFRELLNERLDILLLNNKDGGNGAGGRKAAATNTLSRRKTVDADHIAVIKAFDSFEVTQELDRASTLRDCLDDLEKQASSSGRLSIQRPLSLEILTNDAGAKRVSNAEEDQILHVRVISARGLNESKNMYCELSVDGASGKRKTQQVDAELGSPYWDEVFSFPRVLRSACTERALSAAAASSSSPMRRTSSSSAAEVADVPYMRVAIKFERNLTHLRFLAKKVRIASAILNIATLAERGTPEVFEWYPLVLSEGGGGMLGSKKKIRTGEASVQMSVYWQRVASGENSIGAETKNLDSARNASPSKTKKLSPLKVKLKSEEIVVADSVGAGRIIAASSHEKSLSKLYLTIVRGQNLLASDLNGKSDPYCIVQCAGEKQRTPTIKKTLNPEWNYRMEFGGKLTSRQVGADDEVVVRLYDHDTFSKDDPLGEVHIPIWMIADVKEAMWFPVEPVAHMSHYSRRKELGRILVKCDFRRGAANFEDMSVESSMLMRQPTKSLFRLGHYVKDRPILRVHVSSARHIPALDSTGFSDPYCILQCGTEKFRTRVQADAAPTGAKRSYLEEMRGFATAMSSKLRFTTKTGRAATTSWESSGYHYGR